MRGRIETRLSALEAANPSQARPVIVLLWGEPELPYAAALAAYEAKHGPVGDAEVMGIELVGKVA